MTYSMSIFFLLMIRLPPRSTRTDTLFPYTTLFRSLRWQAMDRRLADLSQPARAQIGRAPAIDPCFGVEQREATRVMASPGEAGFGERHLQGAPVTDMVAEDRPVHQPRPAGREVLPQDLLCDVIGPTLDPPLNDRRR